MKIFSITKYVVKLENMDINNVKEKNFLIYKNRAPNNKNYPIEAQQPPNKR